MTGEDIIAGNPQYKFHKVKVGHRTGLAYTDEAGHQQWVIWKNDCQVSGPGPWTPEQTRYATRTLNDMQPGKTYATVYDDRLAARLRQSGITPEPGRYGLQAKQETSA